MTQDTEEKDGMRIYPVPGPNGKNTVKYPSVTTVLNILPMAENLRRYIEYDPQGSEKNRRKRAMVGSTAHYYFECLNARKIPNHTPVIENTIEWRFFNAKTAKAIGEICKKLDLYVRFNNFEPLFLEQKIWSHELETAGRVDFIGKLNGVTCILDLKTAKAFYKPANGIDPHALQLSAYRQGLREIHGIEVEKLYILRVNEAKKPELKPVPDDTEGFRMAREMFRDKHRF